MRSEEFWNLKSSHTRSVGFPGSLYNKDSIVVLGETKECMSLRFCSKGGRSVNLWTFFGGTYPSIKSLIAQAGHCVVCCEPWGSVRERDWDLAPSRGCGWLWAHHLRSLWLNSYLKQWNNPQLFQACCWGATWESQAIWWFPCTLRRERSSWEGVSGKKEKRSKVFSLESLRLFNAFIFCCFGMVLSTF